MTHSSNNSSSNLSGNLNVSNITHNGARLIMSHAIAGFSGGINTLGQVCDWGICDGVTAGDAIRYDNDTNSTSFQTYVRAQADTAENSEIVGVIESIDGGIVNVVLSGQIIYPTHRLVASVESVNQTTGITGAAGGNDVYFLSEATAGYIQNLAPTTPTTIAKPILQRASDGDFNAHVVNYIGYQIGGQAVGNRDDEVEDFTIKTVALPPGGELVLGRGQYRLDKSNQWLSLTPDDLYYNVHTGDTFKNLLGKGWDTNPYGARWRIVGLTGFTHSLFDKLKVEFRDGFGKELWSGVVEQIGDPNETGANVIYVKSMESTAPPAGNTTIVSSKNEKVITVEAERTALAVPRVQSRNSVPDNFLDINNKSVTTLVATIGQFLPDSGRTAITVPSDLTIPQINAKDIKLEDASFKISNLFEFLRTMSDQVESTKKSVDGSGTSVSSTMKYTTL